MTQTIPVGTGPLSLADVVAVARGGAGVELTDGAVEAIRSARTTVEALAASATPSYGISTGFGALATRHIPSDLRAQLQRSLIRSHAAGSGPEVEREVVRALMVLRISTLATGRTGVRPATLIAYAGLLNAGITPIVHEYGSLGCSGDLAPLAHCALALIGEGLSNHEIGTRLVVSPATARTHVSRVMTKLGARDRAQLVVIAYQSGLVR